MSDKKHKSIVTKITNNKVKRTPTTAKCPPTTGHKYAAGKRSARQEIKAHGVEPPKPTRKKC